MTNGHVVVIGAAFVLAGLATMWWPLALLAGGVMLVTGGIASEWADTRSTEDENDTSA